MKRSFTNRLQLLCFLLVAAAGFSLDAQPFNIDFTLKYNLTSGEYEVYGRSALTESFATGGGSQISVVVPASVANSALTITDVAGGPWTDNSQVYAPTAQTVSDFHGIASNGTQPPVAFMANTEALLFKFSLAGGCLPGVRLYRNAVEGAAPRDPDSNQPGMLGGDYENYFTEVNPIAQRYQANYLNTGSNCGPDTDGDGNPDLTDADDDADGIVDAQDPKPLDTDNDGTNNDTDPDDDGDGLADTGELAANLLNTDNDAFPNETDTDDDADGIADTSELGTLDGNGKYTLPDTDGDGLPDLVDPLDSDNDGTPDIADTDDDADGIVDTQDPKPLDTDNDGTNNATDPDDDGDGIPDTAETLANVLNTDNDAFPNETDTDDDADGIADTAEQGVLDGNGKYTLPDTDGDGLPDLVDPIDTDGDGTPDIADADDDNDGIADTQDPKPLDTDNDGINNAVDPDDDGDGISDLTDAFPFDTDNDGDPNTTDTDDDDDGIVDINELGPLGNDGKYTLPDADGDGLPDLADPLDTDGDGTPDVADTDDDADGIADTQDPKPLDTDNDGTHNSADPDDDGDGILDTTETLANLLNTDNDALPNATDTDDDGDGIPDAAELGTLDQNGKYTLPDVDGDGLPDLVDPLDSDNDGTPDTADTDDDADGIVDAEDPKPLDTDNDGTNNSTDPDDDGDGIADIAEAPGNVLNTDNDAFPNETDTDDDADGIADTAEQGILDPNGKYTLPDTDGDGLPDLVDPLDTDGDGTPDSADLDDDADGIADTQDPKPLDTDNDGTNNSGDPDDDGDGILDTTETLTNLLNTDNDAFPNATDNDDDADGIADSAELGVLDPNGKYTLPDTDGDGLPDLVDPLDTDGDGTPDTADLDDDADGIADTQDPKPLDTDNDGTNNATDPDDDGDGILDTAELPVNLLNTDNDAFPNATDNDDDGDGIADSAEIGTLGPNGKYTLPDSDGDGLPDLVDPLDTDGDGTPDVADLDDDADGIADTQDPKPLDSDNDGTNNAVDSDDDGDGVADISDNFPLDTDNDGQPNATDNDDDGDGIADTAELGPLDGNGKYTLPDSDGDGLPDLADPLDSDGDGISDLVDLDDDNDGIRDTVEGNADTDGDGLPNARDLDSDNDGISDVLEANGTDATNDGRADGTPDANGIPTSALGGLTLVDTDGDTVPDNRDLDTDNDGISDALEAGPTATDTDLDGILGPGNEAANIGITGIPAGGLRVPVNTDGTGAADWRDLDADNDGVNDVKENAATAALDANNDGKVDAADTDGDGIANTPVTDPNAIFGGGFTAPDDTNNDGTPNYQQNNFIHINLKVMLQGALLGTSDGLMRDDLRTQNRIPLAQPYSAAVNQRFAQVGGGGSEVTTALVLAAGAGTPNAIVDWVLVEIHSGTPVVRTISALVQRDGDVVGADGLPLNVALNPGAYSISVKHRNHLGTSMAAPVTVAAGGTMTVDFTTLSDAAVFNNAGYEGVERATVNYTGGSVKALWAGNTSADGKTKYDGSANDRTVIASEVIAFQGGTGVYNFNNALGYFFGDVNMDGKVKYDGSGNDRVLLQQLVQNYPLNTGLLNNYNNMNEQMP